MLWALALSLRLNSEVFNAKLLILILVIYYMPGIYMLGVMLLPSTSAQEMPVVLLWQTHAFFSE